MIRRLLIVCQTVVMLQCAAAIASQAEQSAANLSARQASIVKLFGAGLGNLDSYGSGTLISPEGHVLTIWNHLINTGYLTAVTSDGTRYDVEVVGTSRDYDIAILKLQCGDDEVFPYVDLSSTVDATPGQSVFAFSNMFHVATGAEPVSVVHGVVAQKVPIEAGIGRWSLPVQSPVYIVDAVINNSGAGGGLLTTTSGAPIGLIGREIQLTASSTWINYAVPLQDLSPVVRALLSGDSVDRTTAADDTVAMSDRELTARFGMTLLPVIVQRTPCYIDSITPDSVAEQAGLKQGDLIVLLDDDIIVSVTDFRTKLARRRAGQPITMTVQRNQQLNSVTLRVPEKP
jgi:serine protease Do